MTTERFDLNHIQQLEANYVMPTYARYPVLFVRGEGSTLYDDKGQAYVDFISGIGVNVLGYNHPRVRRALNEQAELPHTSNLFYHPYQGKLAQKLVEASGLAKVFFCNTGTEATEGAMKAARAWQRKRGRENKTEYISLYNSFHGRSMGALSITAQKKYREPFEPLIPGVSFIHANDHEEAEHAEDDQDDAAGGILFAASEQDQGRDAERCESETAERDHGARETNHPGLDRELRRRRGHPRSERDQLGDRRMSRCSRKSILRPRLLRLDDDVDRSFRLRQLRPAERAELRALLANRRGAGRAVRGGGARHRRLHAASLRNSRRFAPRT